MKFELGIYLSGRFRPSLRSVSGEQPRHHGGGGELTAEEEKRRSTGSISSLVRMWEPADGGQGSSAATSPCSGQPPSQEEGGGGSRPGSVVKFEKRVWPPVSSSVCYLLFDSPKRPYMT
jgi:hypothetical protein